MQPLGYVGISAMARLASSHNKMFRQAAAAYLKPPSHSAVLPGYRNPGYPYSAQLMYPGSIPDTDQGLQTLDGGTPYRSVMRVVRSSGSLAGSPGTSHSACLCQYMSIPCRYVDS